MSSVESTKSSVLSTLNPDGSRRWIKPKPSRGKFWHRRRVVAYTLIALFSLIPYLRLAGRPLMQFNITGREFSLFGSVFYPTDTVLLALLAVSIFVTIFLLTALFGRVWCGWACPQTVYMEFLYRPIERLFEGEPGKKQKTGAWRRPAKYATFLLLSMFLAHTFLAYFVGVDQLRTWVTRSPFEHPISFLVMAGVTGAMMFDFAFFREQTCLVACPYGRLQSVLLDRNSLIVSYDPIRGEPRGKKRRQPKGDVSLKVVDSGSAADEVPAQGDCIDCHKCVTTCPTGIDIRNGLQMECIHCTQCIDACDDVMDKIGRPRGLIRYSSQAAIEGDKPRLLRPRVIVYPLILALLLTVFVGALASKQDADVTFIRAAGGMPYFRAGEGDASRIGSRVRIRVRNRTDAQVTYTFGLVDLPGATINGLEDGLPVEAHKLGTAEVVVLVPPKAFGAHGRRTVTVRVEGSDGFGHNVSYSLIGPAWLGDRDDDRDEADGSDETGESPEGDD